MEHNMKKIILLTLFAFASASVAAESMQFVTLLSQPVGSFAKIDLMSDASVKIYSLNFCNTSASNGLINVGKEPTSSSLVQLAELRMGAGNTLTGNIPQVYVSKEMRIGTGADATIGHLDVGCGSGDGLEFSEESEEKYIEIGGGLYGENAAAETTTVDAASFEKMYISSTARLETIAFGDTRSDSFSWTNINASDCSSKGTCKNELLLVGDPLGVDSGSGEDCEYGERSDGSCKEEYWNYKVTLDGVHSRSADQACKTGYYSTITNGKATLANFSADTCKSLTFKVQVTENGGGTTWPGDCTMTLSYPKCRTGWCNEGTYQEYCVNLDSYVTAESKVGIYGGNTCTYQTYVCDREIAYR